MQFYFLLPIAPPQCVSIYLFGVSFLFFTRHAVNASQIANVRILEVVGIGKPIIASFFIFNERLILVFFSNHEPFLHVIDAVVMLFLLQYFTISCSSMVLPEHEIASNTSSLRIHPKSPCIASVGCMKKLATLIDEKIADIFFAII